MSSTKRKRSKRKGFYYRCKRHRKYIPKDDTGTVRIVKKGCVVCGVISFWNQAFGKAPSKAILENWMKPLPTNILSSPEVKIISEVKY